MLGPVRGFDDAGAPVEIGGVRVRMLLARLALAGGRAVTTEGLVDDLWGEAPPAGAASALQALVSRLRKALSEAGSVEFSGGGYRLPMAHQDVDAHRFEELAGQGRRELAAGRYQEASSALGAALALWRGAALADVQEAPFAQVAAARLDELRAAAAEDLFEAEIRLGRHAEVLADLGAAAVARPLSERLAELRMRALSAAGRQSDALAVYAELRQRLDDELGVDPSPEVQSVYLALLRGELDRPSAAPAAAPSRLPAQLTSFVGRETELAQLAGLVTGGRLVTIVGPGGAGKTRICLEAVTRDPAYARGRVWFIPLAGVGSGDQLGDAVLGALGSADRGLYDGKPQQARAADRLVELLDVGDAVLVLDNCEHLVEASAELAAELLDRLPQLRILATSREPLAITGESLFHLGPLGLPPREPGAGLDSAWGSEPVDLAETAESAAVRLFVERAAAVRTGFALDVSTAGAVVEICRRLDGMPLALELAAARLRAMTVEQIARRLDDRFRLLTSGSRSALPRQRTLLAVVEWSWDLLDEQERLLARRMSVFPGGATLAALEGVCSDASLRADDVLYVVNSLVEKSLVDAVGERYRMLETVRAYASAKLVEAGDEVLPKFAAYFLGLAEEQAPLLRTREQLAAIALFDSEHDNMVYALRTAVDGGDAELASRYVRALFWYWGNRGMNTQLERFAAFSPFRLSGYGSEGAREIHPAHLLRLAQQAFVGGSASYEDALASSDPWVRASAHWARNFMLVEQGDLRTGADASLEALRGFEEVGDRWGLVMSLLAVGRLPSLRGEFGRSVELFERAVAVSAELGTEDYLFWTRTRLARERMRSGDLAGGGADVSALQRRARELGHRRREASLLFSLANLYRRSGDIVAADEVVDRMSDVVHRLPYPEEMARDLMAGTRLMNRLWERDAAGARALLPRAVRPNFARGQSNGLAWAAEQVSELLFLEGDAQGSAFALGMSEAIRGAFDEGEIVVRRLVVGLVETLGEGGYLAAYREGATLARPAALERLADLTAVLR
ncbi:BTAD domain-containing putative transcriptional regulator [Actinoallomurus acanthiterrae]